MSSSSSAGWFKGPWSTDQPGLPQALPTAQTKSSEDDRSTSKVVAIPKTPVLDLKTVRQAVLLKGSGHGKMKINSLMHQTSTMPVMDGAISASGAAVTGIYSVARGFAALASTSDWALFIQLFEVWRVKRIHVHWEPFARGQTASGQVVHGPVVFCYDPETQSTVSFNTMSATRLITDKRVHQTATDQSIKRSWTVEEKTLAFNTGALVSTIGSWNSVVTASSVIPGALLISTAPNAANANLTYGVYSVQFDVEWGFRT